MVESEAQVGSVETRLVAEGHPLLDHGVVPQGDVGRLVPFGTFAVRQKSQRMGRNPKTGDEVPIAPRRVLVFRPSHVLKAIINGETPKPEAEDED